MSVPKLRFPEFRDAPGWEEKRLGDISSSIFDGTHQTPTYTTEGVPFYSVENIISGNKNKFISRKDYIAATSKNKPEQGDILLTRIGKIGFSQVVDWDHDFSVYVTLAVIKQSKSFDPYYLHYFIQSDRYQAELRKKSLLNAVPSKINMDSLRNTVVLLPESCEQQKIADCLSSIDELIAAQSQKLDTLKAHKKGLMQQLFPAEGETLPRLRFPEFRDAPEWEEKTLDQVAIYENGKAHENNITETGKYIVVNSKFISTGGEIQKYSDEAFCIADAGDLLMVLSDVPNGRAIAKCYFVKSDDLYTVNQRICKIKPKEIDGKFLFYVLDRNPFFLAFDDGVKQTNLRKEDVLNCPIYLPSLPEEQKKISDLVSSIDELIAAQSQKLDMLKAHKKGLMQQLFPAPDEVQA